MNLVQIVLSTNTPNFRWYDPIENQTQCTSGAGTILGQGGGGQERERQSRERNIKFFAEIGVFIIPKTSVP